MQRRSRIRKFYGDNCPIGAARFEEKQGLPAALQSDVSEVESFGHAVFLQAITKVEALAPHGGLEDVEAAIEDDLPAGVGDDIASMGGARGVERPGEIDTGAGASLRDTVQ